MYSKQFKAPHSQSFKVSERFKVAEFQSFRISNFVDFKASTSTQFQSFKILETQSSKVSNFQYSSFTISKISKNETRMFSIFKDLRSPALFSKSSFKQVGVYRMFKSSSAINKGSKVQHFVKLRKFQTHQT